MATTGSFPSIIESLPVTARGAGAADTRGAMGGTAPFQTLGTFCWHLSPVGQVHLRAYTSESFSVLVQALSM